MAEFKRQTSVNMNVDTKRRGPVAGALGEAEGSKGLCVRPSEAPVRRDLISLLSRSFFCTCVLAQLLLLTGCSVTKYLPEGEYLYDGSQATIEGPAGAELTAEVNAVLDNNTNAKVPLLGYYGIYRWYKFEEKLREKPDKFGDKEHWGTEPIFYDENVVETVNALIENRASNEGYFRNESDWTLDTNYDARTVSANFTLTVEEPYTIDTVEHFWRDSSIAGQIERTDIPHVLQPGMRFDLDEIKGQRQQWQDLLRSEGYYFARAGDFSFLADTVQGRRKVKMLAKLQEDVPVKHLRPQRVVAINVYANAASRADVNSYGPGDTTVYKDMRIICRDCPLRPEIVDEAFAMEVGDLYSPRNHRKTLQRLADYQTFRYIAMEYEEVPGSDSTLVLNAYMEPRLKRRFEGEVGLSYNNADYFGPNLKLAYVNRNLLRGAELLRIEGDFTYAQFLGTAGEARVPNSGIYGLTASLKVPRLWLPKRRKLIPRVFTSGTTIEIGGKVESLSLTLDNFREEIADENLRNLAQAVEDDPDVTERLSLQQFRFQYGYTWKRRVANQHALNPISIRFQNPSVSDEEVLELAQSVNLAPGAANAQTTRFDRMLVFSPNYSITVDGRLNGLSTHEFFFRQFISGNVNNVFPVGRDADLREREVSIYPILDTDFRYYLTLSSQFQFATRLRGGAAFPLLSDRAIVPYFDLFTIGGPNSLRGWAPRQLGPGRTVPFANNLLSSAGLGNVIIETSAEVRWKFNPLVELAFFADAGNVWTYRTELEALETDFKTSAFSGDLAIDAGVGLRFDLQFLIFRIDLARQIQTPYAENAELLRIPYAEARNVPDLGTNLVLAFGYPF